MSKARWIIGPIFTALCGLVVWVYGQQGAQRRACTACCLTPVAAQLGKSNIPVRLRACTGRSVHASAPGCQAESSRAAQVQTLLIDALDGSPADGTVRFGARQHEHEMDLNGEHAY